MKDEKLTQKELDQVSGGNMLESMYDSSYLKFGSMQNVVGYPNVVNS